ncbi:solute carrier family 22 member 3-like [Plodia interpunctella]|uniref:solute carrier family 22 member 3-like n=1 Tax=Plodia interpunctella TaxID=58824 RepID=UPI002368842D|nr:solute carrier family 22 member 3-like [Plodia interpunctella]XP_053603750.1 solute carrier family 22 member 3-like [Plodia interpunctella]
MKSKKNVKKYIVNQIIQDKQCEDDYVTKCMGAFGIWQALVCLLVSITRVIAGWHIITIVYLTPNTDFVCVEFDNDKTDLDEVKNNTCYDDCVKYAYNNTIFETTLTSEFELICGRSWMASFTQTILMLGLFMGVNLFGWISDRYGRRISLTVSVAVPVIFSIASPFATNYWTFNFLRFFIGLGCGGIFAVSIVLIVEITGSQYRELGGGLGIIVDGIGQATLVIFAYYSTTWRIFILSLGLVSTLILSSLIFLPETPRWLMANKQNKKALELMTRVAKFNNLSTDNIKENIDKAIKEIEEKQKNKTTTPGFTDLFKTKEMSLITIFSTIVWCVAGVCFFGINQYVTLLGSNVHIIVLASGLVQIPANVSATVLNIYCGRKTSSFSFAIITGIVMGILSFIPDGDWAATFAVAGLYSASALFTVLIVQVTELFPTVLRSKAYGVNSGGSKLASMIAPFVVNIKPHWISSIIFSITALIGAGFSLLLPETKGITLKDTSTSKEAVA